MTSIKPFDVLGLGAVAVDDLIYVDEFPPADAKTPVERAERQCGGLTATALVAVARLGGHCGYAGVLGNDELSNFAIRRLTEEGVDLSLMRCRPEARPVHSTIIVASKRNTRNIFFDLRGSVGADPDWPPEANLAGARVLLVDHFGLPGMIRAARLARARGIPVVADLERVAGPEFPELMQQVDHLIVSQGFARAYTGLEHPEAMVKALWTSSRALVAVTGGEAGCWYTTETAPDQVCHQAAFVVRAIDTTGCGDVFHGAYALALARGMSVDERLRLAAGAAALKATRPGGQAGIPTWGSLEEFLRL